MNITDLISFKGDDVALLERKGYRTYPLTYNELNEKVLKTQTYLKNNNLKKGDKVLVQAPNCINYVVLMLACLKLGIIFIPLDFHTSKKLREKIIKEALPNLVFTNLDNLEKNTENLPEDKTISKVVDTLLKNNLIDEVICINDGSTDTSMDVLNKYKGNISRAADELGLTRASLYRRLEKYGL